ncbi:MAG TPA: hypothetical protein DCG75_01445 [Bacteroidales bacterium]|nr:hypothetical protein [Bacteroidales bacterium]
MILPSKHIRFSESLLGLGGVILNIINEPKTIDEIWFKFSEINNNKRVFPAYHNFDNVVLALNYLFVVGAVSIDKNGKIKNAVN